MTLGGNQLVLNDKVFAGNAITSVNFTDVVYQLDGDPFVGNPITEIRFNEDDTQVFNTTRIGSNDPAEVDVYTEWQTSSCTWATENGYNVILASGSYWYLTPVSTDAADGLTLVITGNVPSFINGGWPWSDVDDSIGDYAPYIKHIVIDGAVSTLGDRAFANCTALESITVSDFVTSIGFNAIPSGATIICSNGSAAYDYAQSHGNPVVTDYTVQVSYSAPEKLTGIPVSGGGTFTSGTSVTVTASRLATPADPRSTNGYDFDGWYIVAMNGMPLRRPLLVSSELTYTFTLNSDVTLSAKYKVHEPNNYIEVEGFREPIAGETPNKKITLPDGTQISGMLRVKDGENYVNVSGAYEAGREYMITFLLTDTQARAPYVKIRGQFVKLDTLQGGGKAFTVSFVAHNFTVEETLSATCTDDGERVYTSADSDYDCTFTEAIPALGHTEVATVELEPGCETEGVKSITCSECEMFLRTESIAANGHTFGDWIDAVAAVDCANPGIVGHYNCGECGKNFDAEYNELETVLVEIPHNLGLIGDSTPSCTSNWINYPERPDIVSVELCSECNAACINYTNRDPIIIPFGEYNDSADLAAIEAHWSIHYDADCNYVCDLCGEILDHTCVDNNNDCICDFCGAQLAHDWHFVYDTTFSCERPYIDWPENTNFASAEICTNCGAVRINYVSGESRIIAADDVATDEEVLALDAHMKQHDWRQVYDTTPICDDVWINWPENTNFASADYCDACGSARINYVSGDPRIVAADDIATDEEIAALEAHMAIHYDADSNGFCDLCDAGIGDNAGFTLLPTADSEELAYGAYWFNMEGAKEYQLSLYEPGTSDYKEINYMFNVAVIGISDDGNTLRFVSHDARNNPIIVVVSRDEPDFGELWFSHLHQHGIGPVELEDPTTEVTVTAEAGVIPENTALVVVPDAQVANFVIGNGTVENYNHEAFDISLEDANGNEVQPQGGSVTVKLPIPVGYDKSSIKVYFVDDNGNKTDMNATVEGDYAVFTVDHFSKYVLVDETCLHNGETEVRDAVTATCKTEGYTGDTWCLVCGNMIEEGESTGLDENNHEGDTELRGAVTATCKTEGYSGDTWCLGCNAKIADGHSTGLDENNHEGDTELRGVVTGNCHTDGYTGDLYCLGCGNVKEAGHSTGKDMTKHDGGTEVRNAKAATCKTDGYTGDTYCKGCNNKIATGAVISKDTVAHTPGAVVRENVVDATTEHGGSYDEVVRCTVCGAVISSTHKTTNPLPKPADPKPANQCKWCGKVHEGFFQKIVGFFHNIFAAIFGAKY